MSNEPIKPIDIGDLTESVTSAVQRVLASQKENALFVRPPRLICGIIFEPQPNPWILKDEGSLKSRGEDTPQPSPWLKK
jgi:hypothetical protein